LCYQAWELFAALLMDLKFTIDYLYLTSYWGDGLLSLKSMVDLSASIYGYCQAEQFYNKLSELLSDEGMAQLTTRTAAGFIYEIPEHLAIVMRSSVSDFCRAYHAAKIASIVLNFRIS